MGRRSREIVKDEYPWEKIAERTIKIYDEIL